MSRFEAYAETRQSLLELLDNLSEDQLSISVPATPGWSVLDVVRHLTGVARSFTTGKFEGAPGPAWTAGHVDTRKDLPLADVLDEWAGYIDVLQSKVNAGEAGAVVNDIWCHEQDIRGAVKIHGNRDAIAAALCIKSVRAIPGMLEGSGLETPTVVVDSEVLVEGGNLTLTMAGYQAARMIFGRRSASQISQMDWSDAPGELVSNITIFGPSETDIFDD